MVCGFLEEWCCLLDCDFIILILVYEFFDFFVFIDEEWRLIGDRNFRVVVKLGD